MQRKRTQAGPSTIGAGNGYADDRTGATLTTAIMAMNGPDWAGGNVTLVGRIGGKPTVVTVEESY